MNDAYGLTAKNILQSLPTVLQNDPKMQAIASAVSKVLEQRADEIQSILIYPNLSNAQEGVLDILAKDFKVDWYNYDYSVEVKRNLILSSFNVHRHLGTRKAVLEGVQSVYPGALIEEWFEYGGDPYCFRILVNVVNPLIEIVDDDFSRAVDLYKSFRSHLDGVMYLSGCSIKVSCTSGYALLTSRKAGTYPVRSVTGKIATDAITATTSSGSSAITTRLCGTSQGGVL